MGFQNLERKSGVNFSINQMKCFMILMKLEMRLLGRQTGSQVFSSLFVSSPTSFPFPPPLLLFFRAHFITPSYKNIRKE